MIHEIIKNLMSDIKNPIIFEIGARKGEDTEIIAKNCHHAEIFAFEPLIEHHQDLYKIEQQYKNIYTYSNAIGHINGISKFYVSSDPANFKGSSSLRKPKEHLNAFTHVKFDEEREIIVSRLDDFCYDYSISHIDFLWMDVQGAELDIIAGGQEMLKKTKYLYSEYYNNEMYEGQVHWKEYKKQLPGEWQLLHDFGNDVLLENLSYKG